MSMLFVMIPLGVVLVAAAVAFFFWAVADGQFDDLEAQGSRILFDDGPRVPATPERAEQAQREPGR